MARRRQNDDGEVNMTPMIDVVFQLIIFFVVTIQLDKESINKEIKLARAEKAQMVVDPDPRTVTVQVDKYGRIFIGSNVFNAGMLTSFLRQMGKETPIVVRADATAKHGAVQRAVDACVAAGIWKITFVAKKNDDV